jgi:phosphoribosyl-AMP cyclohydrolase / phosphoribosyl-ATP pyrophosphohydrolase
MKVDFKTGNGLIPAVIQDSKSLNVLMVGFMNKEAYKKTLKKKKVTFYSRKRKKLWTKGETSGNYLNVEEILTDCDNDTLLIKVRPDGPVCHEGSYSCFGDKVSGGFLYTLGDVIADRIDNNVTESYTNKLFKRGINKVAQKVGEEAVELVIEAKDESIDLFRDEAADLLYHFLILLKAKGTSLEEIEQVLSKRHLSKNGK